MKRLAAYEILLGAAVALATYGLGWWTNPDWFGPAWRNGRWIFFALAAFFPMGIFAWIATSAIQRGPFRKIFDLFRNSAMGRVIAESAWPSFAFVSAVAGVTEELVFRGILQPHLGNWATSVIFGILHALTPAYFVIATVISFYLGLMYDQTGHLLIVPALAHGLYDFTALILYRRRLLAGPAAILEKS